MKAYMLRTGDKYKLDKESDSVYQVHEVKEGRYTMEITAKEVDSEPKRIRFLSKERQVVLV